MDGKGSLLSKVREYVELHKHTYKSLFHVDLSFVDVKDFEISVQDHARHRVKRNKNLIEKIAKELAPPSFSISQARERVKSIAYSEYFKEGLRDRVGHLLEFRSPNYKNTIFVNTSKSNIKRLLKPPFAKIELSSIHELGHVFFQSLSKINIDYIEEKEEMMKFVMATEGFAEVLSIHYVVPYLNSKILSEKIEKCRKNLVNELVNLYGVIGTKLTKKFFKGCFEASNPFIHASAYLLFKEIDSKAGLDGIKAASRNLPKLEDYYKKRLLHRICNL